MRDKIKSYISNGLLPEGEQTYSLIESGKVKIDDMASDWASFNRPEVKSAFKDNSKEASATKVDTEVAAPESDGNDDAALNNLVNAGKLPPDKEVLSMIKSGEVSTYGVTAAWDTYSKKNEKIIGDDKGVINEPEKLKSDLDGQVETMFQPVSIPEVDTGSAVAAGLKDSAKDLIHIWEQAGMGLTFDIFEAPKLAQRIFEEEPSSMAYSMGKVAQIAGYFYSGAKAASLLRKVPGVGRLFKSLATGSQAADKTIKAAKFAGETVKFGTRVAKHGKAVAALAGEGALLGSVVGTSSGVLHGEDWDDALAEGVTTGALWAAGSVALYPIVAAVGGIFGIRETNKLRKAFKHMSEDEIFAKIKTMGIDDLISTFEAVPKKARNAEFNSARKALLKIKAANPEMGVVPNIDLAKNPDISKVAVNQFAKESVDALYSNKGAPLKYLLNESTTVKTMFNNGDNLNLLASTNNMVRESVKHSGDVASLPFTMDAKSAAKVVAGKAVRALEKKKIKGVDRGLFTDFFMDPTKQTLAPLKQAVGDPKALRSAIGVSPKSLMSGTKKVYDVRIGAKEAERIANDYLETYLKTVSTDGAISFADISKLKTSNGIMRSATVMNRNFARNMIEGSAKLVDEENVVGVNNNLRAGVRSRIQARSALADSADDIIKINEIKKFLANIPDDIDDAVVAGAKKDLKNAHSRLAGKNRRIREFEADVAGYGAEDIKEIDNLVSKIHAPTEKELGNLAGSQYMKRFGYKESPYYVKEGTELADTLSMMLAGGKDVGYTSKEPWIKNATKVIGPKYFASLQRKFRTQFGYNSSFEVLFRDIKTQYSTIKDSKAIYIKGLEGTGIARGTKSSKAAFGLAKGNITTSSEEFLSLHPIAQEKAVKAAAYVRQSYDELFGAINGVRKDVDMPLRSYRENYVTNVPKRKGFISAVKESLTSSKKEIVEEGTKVYTPGVRVKADPRKPFTVHDKPQTGKGDHYEDIVEAFEGYLDDALEQIHLTKIGAQIDAARGFAPEGVAEILNHVKNNIFKTAKNPFNNNTEGVVNKGFEVLMKKRAEGLILGSLNVVFQQATSAAMSLMVSPKNAILATTKMFSKEYDELFKLSNNGRLASPSEGVDIDKSLISASLREGESIMHVPKAAYNYYKKFLSYGFRKFDMGARKHAWTTACETFKEKGGMDLARANGRDPQKAMVSYADDWADMIHGSFSQIDKPEALNSTLGRAFLQFQSFSMNLATTMSYDLPRMAYKEGAYRVSKGLLEFGASASIINEVCAEAGIPKPFDLFMFMPFLSTYRFGNAGLAQATYDFIKDAASTDTKNKGATWRNAISAGASVAFPGSRQVYKGSQAFGRVTTKRGKLSFDTKAARKLNKPMAMAFGSYPQYEKKLQKDIDRRPSKQGLFQKTEKKAQRYIKKGLFK